MPLDRPLSPFRKMSLCGKVLSGVDVVEYALFWEKDEDLEAAVLRQIVCFLLALFVSLCITFVLVWLTLPAGQFYGIMFEGKVDADVAAGGLNAQQKVRVCLRFGIFEFKSQMSWSPVAVG